MGKPTANQHDQYTDDDADFSLGLCSILFYCAFVYVGLRMLCAFGMVWYGILGFNVPLDTV